MGSRIIWKMLLIMLLILLATPLLGALALVATGGSMAQMPGMMSGRMLGLATIWIAMTFLLIVVSIITILRSLAPKDRGKEEERDKAA
jgi:uncharacterized membrane protein